MRRALVWICLQKKVQEYPNDARNSFGCVYLNEKRELKASQNSGVLLLLPTVHSSDVFRFMRNTADDPWWCNATEPSSSFVYGDRYIRNVYVAQGDENVQTCIFMYRVRECNWTQRSLNITQMDDALNKDLYLPWLVVGDLSAGILRYNNLTVNVQCLDGAKGQWKWVVGDSLYFLSKVN